LNWLPGAEIKVIFWGSTLVVCKEKTSVTLSKEILAGVDRMAGSKHSRSAFIEAALARYLRQQARARIEARDLELINKAADELNEEVEDILRYQQT
jgi:metal-responsive CopG/Arc/MetJ family transcriptional regulator